MFNFVFRVKRLYAGAGVEHIKTLSNMDEQDWQDKKSKPLILFILCIHVQFCFSGKALVFEFWVAEIDQQSDFDSGGVEIVDDLRLTGCWAIADRPFCRSARRRAFS